MKKASPVIVTLAALALLFCAGLYAATQQILRQGANDPQIQIAEDGAATLARGDAVSVPAAAAVDVASSLAPFVIVYDASGNVTQSTGRLHGATPSLPAGVLSYAKAHHEDRFTWQPETGVRIAAVVVSSNGAHPGYVLAGRNLGEVEKRENQMMLFALGVFVASLIVIGAFAALPKA